MLYRVKQLPRSISPQAKWDAPAWQGLPSFALDNYMGDVPAHRPHVEAKLGWNEEDLSVIFRVEDQFVRAVAKNHQDAVYKDSCVEFFFTPGLHLGRSYFNLEMNCGGTMLFWWHPEDGDAVPVSMVDCNQIQTAHSLPRIVDPEIETPTTWTLEYRFPIDLIQSYCPEATRPAAGIHWKANFYKCADGSSRPHWLTWAPVDFPKPNFHLPEFFGTIDFEGA